MASKLRIIEKILGVGGGEACGAVENKGKVFAGWWPAEGSSLCCEVPAKTRGGRAD